MTSKQISYLLHLARVERKTPVNMASKKCRDGVWRSCDLGSVNLTAKIENMTFDQAKSYIDSL